MRADEPTFPLDRVNPVTKIAAAVILCVPLLVTLDWVSALVALVLEIIGFGLLGAGFADLARRCWPLLLLAPIGAISMALYGAPEGREFFQLGWIHITENSLRLALAVFIRVIALGVSAVMLFARVDPTDMGDGLAQIARLPARFVLGTMAAVRMVGLFIADWRVLGQARRARGLGDRGVFRRFFTMAFALLVFAIRRGSTLATAMEARGFGAGPRTWARESRLHRADAVCLAACVACVGVAIGVAVATGWFRPVLG